MGRVSDSDLPEHMLAVLPDDPYDQLDIARKITSMAVTSRVGQLEAEAGLLRRHLAEKELLISDLQERVGELQQALQHSTARLSLALDEQTKLTTEKNALAASVKKLNRDVAKLEIFKRTLMHSLQEEDENHLKASDDKQSTDLLSVADSSFSSLVPQRDSKSLSHQQMFSLTKTNLTPELTPSVSPKRQPVTTPPRGRSAAVSPKIQSVKGSPKWHSIGDGRVSLPSSMPTSKHSTEPNSPPHAGSHSARTDMLSAGDSSISSLAPQRDSQGLSHQQMFSLTKTNLTPELIPSASPKRHPMTTPPRGRSAAVSPKIQSVKGSPKWHSIGDGRLSLPSSMPSSKHSTAPNSPPHAGSHSARTARVDGKEFFRRARNRLSYEQFSAFLTNIKELNAHKQTKEETLRKVSDIFGPGNDDLYCAFDGLLSHHLPGQG